MTYSIVFLVIQLILTDCIPRLMPPFCWGKGVKPPTKFSKKGGGFDRISIFRAGLLGKKRVFILGGGGFYMKNKLISELFNDKKSL